MTNEAYKHLFESAISALAAIDRELGLPDDGCNATALTIAEIQRLKKLAAISNAAAKAETAAPVVGRWYFVTNDGAATLCVDEADARESAAEADIAFPRMAPHRAVQLVPADQLAAAVAQERERCIGIIESHHIPVGNSAAGEMACEWTYDALKTIRDAIRAGAPPDTLRDAARGIRWSDQ